MNSQAVTVDPDIQGGTPCFTGTRVPVVSLFDYLQGDYNVTEFLEQFPSVKPQQVDAVLRIGRSNIEAMGSVAVSNNVRQSRTHRLSV